MCIEVLWVWMTINAIVNTLCGTTDTRRTYSCDFCGLCVLVVFSGVGVYFVCSLGVRACVLIVFSGVRVY